MITIDDTHDPARESWVETANLPDSDFPIQNLPFGRFRLTGEDRLRIGVAIGDHVLDLDALGHAAPTTMRELLALGENDRQALRSALSRGLSRGSTRQWAWGQLLHHRTAVSLVLPVDIGDYTDFYAGIHHASAVGKLFRPDQPLLPNYRWVPVAYHGRASTVLVSGTPFRRPRGQIKRSDQPRPELQPSQRLDFELEIGVIIGRPSAFGEAVKLSEAESHVFGLTLLNDWSARDIQAWEYQPLGPFLAKNFATTLSPWIVTLEALAPFRTGLVRPPEDPPSLDYLESEENRQRGAFDIALEVYLQTAAMREKGLAAERISNSNFAQAAYWTVAQMVAHHTVNGCALSAGDLLGSGTLSGMSVTQAGSLMELTRGGSVDILLDSGECRRFLEDGDAVTFKATCVREGFRRIGFGECVGTVCPPLP